MASPVTVLLAGPPGIGKSACVVRAFGKKAFWVCAERGALHVARNPEVNPGGQVPDHVECLATVNPWAEAFAAVQKGCEGVRAGKYVAVVIDTLSSLADRETDYVQRTVSDKYGRQWAALGSHLRQVVNEALACGAIVVAICHYDSASDFHGARPRLPGKLGSEAVPSLFDIVLRCEMRAGPDGKPVRVFRRDASDPLWKDRTGVVVDGEPMDLRSVVRRATQRLRGLAVDAPPVSLIATAEAPGATDL